MPPARKIPVVPRPRQGELSGSFLARLARANRTELRTFTSLLGRLPAELPSNGHVDLAVTVLTLNEAAFSRLLTYTGCAANQLIRAIPSLAPKTFTRPDEPPAIRISFLQVPAVDCRGCRLRRGGAYLDTRMFPHKTVCLRHSYWLYGQGGGQRLDLGSLPEVAVAQRRLARMAARYGPSAAMHAYRIAAGYLDYAWRIDYHPRWYPTLITRWQQRIRAGDHGSAGSWPFLGWALHPEATALAAVFASPASGQAGDPRGRQAAQALLPTPAYRTRC